MIQRTFGSGSASQRSSAGGDVRVSPHLERDGDRLPDAPLRQPQAPVLLPISAEGGP
jgi:hypothetical protein